MAPGKWATLKRLFGEWISEEENEKEHQGVDGSIRPPPFRVITNIESSQGRILDPKSAEDNAAWDSWERKGKAASVAFTTHDGRVLLLRRAKDEENWPDTWAFPGGKADDGEDDESCARREAVEECGDCTFDGMSELEHTRTPNDFEHVTYVVPVKDEFEPKLSKEHSEHRWAHVTDLPEPVHPGVRAAIDRVIGRDITADESEEARKRAEGKLSERTRQEIGREGSEHREEMPDSDFLEPKEKKYPVKKEGKYDRSLLLAAARRARINGEEALAKRADEIREREFPAAARDIAVDWDSVAEHAILAYDRSARVLDLDGRLHVDEANICQGKIDEYYGDEINGAMGAEPGWVMLDPKRRYRLYRDPKELAKPETVKSANGIPILGEHVQTDAKNHKYNETIGSTGTTARFDHPFVKNGLNFWPQKAIDDIDDGSKAQLSPGYRYRVDMVSGTTPEGDPYDGRMRDIRFNHLAQVPQGRQGKQVVVPDADPDWRAWATLERAILDMGKSIGA